MMRHPSLLFLILYLFCLTSAQAQPPVPASPATTKAGQETVRVLLVPAREALLASPITARITALNATLGSRFKAGDVLVQFDCDEQAARLRMAEAEARSARETLSSKRQLLGYRSATQLDVDLAESASARARAQVGLMQVQMAYCSLKAPFDGVVAKLHAHAHETVPAGQALLELVDNNQLRLQLYLPSRRLNHVKTGSRFQVTIDETGKQYPAKVQAIGGRVDPASQTVEIHAAIDGRFEELIAGMSGSAEFPDE